MKIKWELDTNQHMLIRSESLMIRVDEIETVGEPSKPEEVDLPPYLNRI